MKKIILVAFMLCSDVYSSDLMSTHKELVEQFFSLDGGENVASFLGGGSYFGYVSNHLPNTPKIFLNLFLRVHQNRFELLTYQRSVELEPIECHRVTGSFDWKTQKVTVDPGCQTDFEFSISYSHSIDENNECVFFHLINRHIIGTENFLDVPIPTRTFSPNESFSKSDALQFVSLQTNLLEVAVCDVETGKENQVQFPVTVSSIVSPEKGVFGGFVAPLGPTIFNFDKKVIIEVPKCEKVAGKIITKKEKIECAPGTELYLERCALTYSLSKNRLVMDYAIRLNGLLIKFDIISMPMTRFLGTELQGAL